MTKRVRQDVRGGEGCSWDAIIRRQEAEIAELKERIGGLESEIIYLTKERWEPLRNAELFDARLPKASADPRSSIMATTELNSAELQLLGNDQFHLLMKAGKAPVSAEDIYLYLFYLRTGLSAMQLQAMYRSSA